MNPYYPNDHNKRKNPFYEPLSSLIPPSPLPHRARAMPNIQAEMIRKPVIRNYTEYSTIITEFRELSQL